MDNFWFWILSGLYHTVTRVYETFTDISINYARDYSDSPIIDVAGTMYILAGVFMLFRVTVSMINMLIDPDKLNDKQAGAGKVITRVITSLLMLILFQPGGWIFGGNGILMRIENALIGGDDSFFSELLDFSEKDDNSNNKLSTIFADEVYAEKDSSGNLTCYYLSIGNNKYDKKKDYSTIQINGKYKITFSTNSGFGEYKLNSKVRYSFNPKATISYVDTNGQTTDVRFNDSFLLNNAELGDVNGIFKNGLPSSCPKRIESVSQVGYEIFEKLRVGNTIDNCDESGLNLAEKITYFGKQCPNSRILVGFETVEEMESELKRLGIKNVIETDDPYINSITGQSPYSSASWKFSRKIAKSFQQCKDASQSESQKPYDEIVKNCAAADEETKNECACLQVNMFDGSSGDTVITEKLGEKIIIDFVSSIIAAVGIIVFLIYLCIEVFVRRFKLILLQMIAPIPIISYVDPNDTKFKEWSKMYISVYLDLFIKLFGIYFAIRLLDGIDNIMPGLKHPIITFYYIVAILIFAKAVPTIISKIFGLDTSSSGAGFKNIFGMAKSALGFGAGAVIGGAVGVASGLGTGGGLGLALSGGLKGALRGAGSGSKGKIFGGADSIRTDNLNTRRANYNGSTAAGRRQAAFNKFFGQSDAYESKKKKLDEFEVKELQPKKEKKASMDAFVGAKDAWEKAILQQRGYRNFDNVPETAEYFKAKEALEGMRASAGATKAAWHKEQVEKQNELAKRAEASGSEADQKAFHDFKTNFDAQYKLSDGEFMTQIGSNFINEKAKEVSRLDYESQLATFEHEISNFKNIEGYKGIAGTEGLYDEIKNRAEELKKDYSIDVSLNHYKDVKDANGRIIETGLKSTGTAVSDESRNLGATIGREERTLTTERRELENSGIKADHDAVTGGK